MSAKSTGILFFIVALMIVPSFCFAQAQSSDQGSSAELAQYIGTWRGDHEECTSGSNCETRSAEVIISNQDGRISVVTNLGALGGGFAKYSKTSKGPVTRTYTGGLEKKGGVVDFTFTTPSGTKVVLKREGDKMIGHGSGGRFTINYRLQKAGS